MKRCLFVLICLLLLSACIKKQCKYEYPIAEIYVLNWGIDRYPTKVLLIYIRKVRILQNLLIPLDSMR